MKWYQLHLSTLLIVSLLAAELIWLNMNEPLGNAVSAEEAQAQFTAYIGWVYRGMPRGWPMTFGDQRGVNFWMLTADIVACLALLAVAAATAEWTTRRMKRKAIP